MYLGYQQVTVSTVVLTIADFTIPDTDVTFVELQAETQNVRYIADNATNPTTTSGMILSTTAVPRTFEIMDFRRMRFIRDGGANATLNVHYFAGRNP